MYSTLDQEGRFSGRSPEAGHVYKEPEQNSDLTIGTAALLGIFFAIVIVCALFFGFGYSVGHRGTKPTTLAAEPAVEKQSPSLAPAPAVSTMQSAAAPVGVAPAPTGSGAAKPSAAYVAPEVDPAPAPTSAQDVQQMQQAESAPAQPQRQFPSAARQAVAAPSTRPAELAPAGTVMVQIAAVVHANDAEALAAALRRDGYNALVRTEPQDHFLHVQVGPFANRDAARAMRAKLQADGYNPILKP